MARKKKDPTPLLRELDAKRHHRGEEGPSTFQRRSRRFSTHMRLWVAPNGVAGLLG